MSVIDEPTQEQFDYLVAKYVIKDEETGEVTSELSEEDIKLGAKYYVTVKRRLVLEDDDLEEEIRMNPCDEDEIFMSAASDCHFDALNIKKKIKELEDNPPTLRRITFFRTIGKDGMPTKVSWREDANGFWEILHFPQDEEKNKSTKINNLICPANVEKYVMGVDGYSNSQGGRKYGSNASAFIMDRSRLMYVAMYFGRPRTKELFHEQITLAAEFYGCKVWYEHTADDYKGYFTERGKLGYLGRYPLSVIDPNKREKQIGTMVSQ